MVQEVKKKIDKETGFVGFSSLFFLLVGLLAFCLCLDELGPVEGDGAGDWLSTEGAQERGG